MMQASLLTAAVLALALAAGVSAQAPGRGFGSTPGDRILADYMRAETRALADRCLADVRTAADWNAKKDTYRRQLAEMLGLSPTPERTPLHAETTGTVDHPQFKVENVVFQSRPGLYVTGNLYLPKGLTARAPAVLYVCGHGTVKKGDVAYGSKTFYQHHGEWFARNGYVCLTIDTLQLGEIEGLHHGVYREGMWWWASRGYTPAGVEAWNGIRALDYLQLRPEVDPERLGITGRSGGGAYSWWIAALDERVKAAVPVAGITDLQNHVVDGCIEGHCDCMFQVNTYRWDYPQVAALVAPRALLIGNSDKDGIFPLDGVVRLHSQVRRIYQLLGAEDKLGLTITEGPHKDTQELQVPAFHWFNRFLKGEDPQVETTAVKLLEPEPLKVFPTLPTDQKNTTIHESFVPAAPKPVVPADAEAWKRDRDGWLESLRQQSFRGWPEQPGELGMKPAFSVEKNGLQLQAWDFQSQHDVPLRLYLLRRAGLEKPELTVLNVLDEAGWKSFLAALRPGFGEALQEDSLPPADDKGWSENERTLKGFKWAMAYVAPRGIGRTAWSGNAQKRVHLRRRFLLLGQTLEGMQTWDVRRALQALRTVPGVRESPTWLQGERQMAGVALYASLFEPPVARLDLWQLPRSHREGPTFLNVLKFMDVPQAVAMAAERGKVRLYEEKAVPWEYPAAVAKQLGWDPARLDVRLVPGGEPVLPN